MFYTGKNGCAVSGAFWLLAIFRERIQRTKKEEAADRFLFLLFGEFDYISKGSMLRTG